MLSGKRVRTRQALEVAVAMFYRIICESHDLVGQMI
jgi:hypothetical protein